RENVWSNLLAFYLDPRKEHGLGNLLLKTLLETLSETAGCEDARAITPVRVKVNREYLTTTGCRIDIVVSSDTFVLGIENKVNAPLGNDLKDYAKAIEKLADEKKCFKIVLPKYPQRDLKGGFVNVLYADLLSAVKRRLGDYAGYADTRYLIFLHDFLNTIENNLNINMMTNNPELMEFILKNENEIIRLSEHYGKFKEYAKRKLEKVCELIDVEKPLKEYFTSGREPEVKKAVIWEDTWVLFCEITFGEIRIILEADIEEGYSLTSYGYFKDKGKYPQMEKDLEENVLRGEPCNDFLKAKEADIATSLQRRLDATLAYLADTITLH
ncbi:MAG: PD-(D/E)XK nuclease family protein, partial [Tannerella sp.]|nr:PD-(D/E)XK nuclease family protein [Tannerella sp.]